MKLKEIFESSEFSAAEEWMESLGFHNSQWDFVDGKIDIHVNAQITMEHNSQTFNYPLRHTADLEVYGDLEFFNGPTSVTGKLTINKFTGKNFRRGPSVIKGFCHIASCEFLTSMEGAPEEIDGGYFYLFNSKSLRSLEHIPKRIKGELELEGAQISSLVGIHKLIEEVHGTFGLDWEHVKEGGLGLILIKHLKELIVPFTSQRDLPEPFKIINKYLSKPEEIFECQSELIEAGYEEFAKL